MQAESSGQSCSLHTTRAAPAILTADAAARHAASLAFSQVANGVWQTGHAPPGTLAG